MDRAQQKKMNEAMKKAKEAQEFQEKAKDISNVEYWENNLKILKDNRRNFLNNLGETNFLIDQYLIKIKDLKKLIK